MRRLNFAGKLIFVLLSVVISSFAQNVKYDSAPGTDFSKYKTYKWQRDSKARYPEPVVDQILISSIDEQLAAKGLTKTTSDSADLYVVYQVVVMEDAALNSITHHIEWQGGENVMAGFSGGTTTSVNMIRKGWMIIDLHDVSLKQNVWQATATKTLGKGKDPKKIKRNAQKAMEKIFRNYPPGPLEQRLIQFQP
jgi:hypothetical protein